MLEYLVIGHVSQDRIGDHRRLGGTAAYAALTAAAIGLQTGILTSARPDLDLSALADIDIQRVASENNTSYENIYGPVGDRSQRLHGLAARLLPDHLPRPWRKTPIAHLGPIADEFGADMLAGLGSSFTGLTPQGWMRAWDARGNIQVRAWLPTAELREQVSAVVVSEEDLGDFPRGAYELAGQFGTLVVTRASHGATIFSQARRHNLPAVHVDREVDATGAGDIFAASFFIELARSGDVLQSARFANYLAGVGVARHGLDSTPTTEEIAQAREAIG